MKNILAIIILGFCFQLNAQRIVAIEKRENYTFNDLQKNIYFKDINGVFNKFLGKWIYKNDNDIVEIEVLKMEKVVFEEDNYYLDELCVKIKQLRNTRMYYFGRFFYEIK